MLDRGRSPRNAGMAARPRVFRIEFIHKNSSLVTTMKSVLIAVHDPNQAGVWAQALRDAGDWLVHDSVRSFSQAHQALLRHRPDLLVADLRLADGTALDLVRVLRTGLNPLPTQILVVTREADSALLLDVLQEGADNFVAAETVTPQSLLALARDTLAGSAEIAPWVARRLLEHFGGAAHESGRTPIEDLTNPLVLTDAERRLLWRLSNGFRVAEVARVEGVRPRELTGRVRAIYRKVQWQLRAGDLSLAV
jgi:DNA-binding NarL/FixJ family response regulator